MKNFIILALSFIVIGLSIYVSVLILGKGEAGGSEKFFLSEWALYPDNHLALAKEDVEKRAYNLGAYEIEKSVNMMRSIESVTDEEGVALVEEAIKRLTSIEEEIKLRDIDIPKLEEASIQAMNTLALVHLKLSDELAREGDNKKAMKSVRTAIKHLQNAFDMASLGSQRVGEALIINELQVLLDSLESNGHLEGKDYTISVNDLVKLINSNK